MKKSFELVLALFISGPFFVVGYLAAWAYKGAVLGWMVQSK